MFEFFKESMKTHFRKDQPEKNLYCDLAPDDDLKNNAEYFYALKWALRNPKIKNIAISGPYGAGKRSIIQSPENQNLADYLKRKAYITSFSTDDGMIKCTVKKVQLEYT